jgi:hypothetical protein
MEKNYDRSVKVAQYGSVDNIIPGTGLEEGSFDPGVTDT